MRSPHFAYRVIEYLMNEEHAIDEDLAHEFNVDPRTARSHLAELHALGLIHICEWDRRYQCPIPVYKWGKRPDKPRPAARTGAEKARRYRERTRTKHSQLGKGARDLPAQHAQGPVAQGRERDRGVGRR